MVESACAHVGEFIIDFTAHNYGYAADAAKPFAPENVAEVTSHKLQMKMRCRKCEERMLFAGAKMSAIMEMTGFSESVVRQSMIYVSDDGYELSLPFGPVGIVVPMCEDQGFAFSFMVCYAPTRTVQ